jgi:hypothetical protein
MVGVGSIDRQHHLPKACFSNCTVVVVESYALGTEHPEDDFTNGNVSNGAMLFGGEATRRWRQTEESLEVLHTLGVRTVMVTGDAPATAVVAIAMLSAYPDRSPNAIK